MPADPRDNVTTRGVKGPSPLGTSLFLGLRPLDIFIQYGILSRAIPIVSGLSSIGISTIPQSTQVVALGLPLKPLLLLAMTAGSALKQVFHTAFIMQEEMPAGGAFAVTIFNIVCNSLNSIISTLAITESMFVGEQDSLSPVAWVGLIAYVVGISVEAISEIQRKRFKADERNKGKVYTRGLFSLARHINYGGYTLWRAGFATVAGGPLWGAFVATFFFADFARRGVPVLDKYCQDRVSKAPVVTHVTC